MEGLERAREGNNDAVILFYSRKNKTENELKTTLAAKMIDSFSSILLSNVSIYLYVHLF